MSNASDEQTLEMNKKLAAEKAEMIQREVNRRLDRAQRDVLCAAKIRKAIDDGKLETHCAGSHLLSKVFVTSLCAQFECSESHANGFDFTNPGLYSSLLRVRWHNPPKINEK